MLDSAPLPPIQVDSRYYPGTLNKRWCAHLLADDPDRAVVVRAHGSPVWSAKDILWDPPGPALEIYPRAAWFNLYCVFHPGGPLHFYYVNIALPPVLAEGRLTYVDLDLDLFIAADLSCEVLDADEFEEHAAQWHYPAALQARAWATVDDLLRRAANGDPLFSEWERYWPQIPAAIVGSTAAARLPPRDAVDAPPGWILPALDC
jgi:protein associated with RNAse G/E